MSSAHDLDHAGQHTPSAALPLATIPFPVPGLSVVALELPSTEAVLSALRNEPLGELATRAVPKRRAEFAAGRHAARLALAGIGVRGPVARDADGAPVWPAGAVGSISHGANVALAAVASTRTHRGVGVDVERIVGADTCVELSARVAGAPELAALARALGGAPSELVFSLIFSAKESLFKCLYPLGSDFFGFEAARVLGAFAHAPQRVRLELELTRELSPAFPENSSFTAHCSYQSDRVLSAVVLECGP